MKYAGKIAKWIVVAFVAVFNIMFIFRCCVADNTSILSDIIPTKALRSAYTDEEVEMITQCRQAFLPRQRRWRGISYRAVTRCMVQMHRIVWHNTSL